MHRNVRQFLVNISVNDNTFYTRFSLRSRFLLVTLNLHTFFAQLIGQTNLAVKTQKISLSPFSKLLRRPISIRPELKQDEKCLHTVKRFTFAACAMPICGAEEDTIDLREATRSTERKRNGAMMPKLSLSKEIKNESIRS